ncbi:MAG: HDOD domain-containing protein [Burkholderiaceae bacterium]
MKITPDEMVASVSNLTTFPAVALRIDRALADENFTVDDIGDILETDPALSVKLLKIANSAYYSRGVEVDSVSRAASVIGSRKVRDIVFTQCATDTFKSFPNDLQSLDDFWNHSLYCAVAAQEIAKQLRYGGDLSLYTAGLLHDIGQLVMFTQYPDESRRALEISINQTDGTSPHLGEIEVFGFDHTAVGASLARQWNFPRALSECIEFHHAPGACSAELATEVAIVHVANSTAVLAELASEEIEDAPEIDPAALGLLGLDTETIVEIAAKARAEVDEMVGVFN